MSWTAEQTDFRKHPQNTAMVQVTLVYTSDQGEVITDTPFGDNLDADAVKARVTSRIASLEARDAALASLEAVGNGPIEPVPPSTDPEADAFFVELYALNDMRNLVAKGLMKPDDPTYQAAQDSVAAKLKEHPEYQKDPRFR